MELPSRRKCIMIGTDSGEAMRCLLSFRRKSSWDWTSFALSQKGGGPPEKTGALGRRE